jgi:hypothetical protein
MDVTGFLCVSVGSSTLQRHDSIGSRSVCACSEGGFSSKNGDRALGLYYRRIALFCVFYGQNDSIQRIFIKKCFLFTVRSVCCVKAIHNLVKKFSQGRSNVADDARPGAEVVETTVKRLQCCGFWCTGEMIRQVYQCWWRICQEINVSFEVRISYVLRFISICDLFTNSAS